MAKTTYIIPIKIESADRARNLYLSVNYLLRNTDGNIIIKEYSAKSAVSTILGELIHNSRVHYVYERGEGAFHRTRLLNDMIEMSDTEITCNYDADVILPESAYSDSEKMILTREADAVYPYPHSPTGQIQIFFDSETVELFANLLNSSSLMNSKWKYWDAHSGFCVFVRTHDYKRAGGEYEGFISYGPEDAERILRLEKMGLTVKRLEKSVVYHMEHVRTHESNSSNPYFSLNHSLYEQLKNMNKQQMIYHLSLCDYIAKRNWKDHIYETEVSCL